MKKNTLLLIICLLATTIGFAQTGRPAPRTPATGANNAASANISIEIAAVPDQTFTGSPVTPEPVIKYGNLTLTKDVDYTLSYTNNTNVGTATMTISGKGNYRDTQSVNFNIIPKSFGGMAAPRPAGGTPVRR
jgi:hypothetical protein